MRDLTAKIDALCHEIRQDQVFTRYAETLAELTSDEETAPLFRKYKSLADEYEKSLSPGFDMEKAVSNLYWQLMLNPNARAFLGAEKELVCFLRALYSSLESNLSVSGLPFNGGS